MAIPGLTLVTPPAVEPVSLADMKTWVRVNFADDDALLTDLITAARQYAENKTGRAIITQTWKLARDSFPPFDTVPWLTRQPRPFFPQIKEWRGAGSGVIRVPKPPLQSVTSIVYVDTDGTSQTMGVTDTGFNYQVDTICEPGRIAPVYGDVWPVTRWQLDAVQVTYVAGYGSSGASVPSALNTAIKMIAAHWYEHREAAIDGAAPAEVPAAAQELLKQFWTGEYD